MAKCFFNNDDSKVYDCEYTIKDFGIEVSVDYDINDEIIPDGCGVRTLLANTSFKDRDIIIVDHRNKKNYLLKDAYYIGINFVWGSLDGCTKTRFRSRVYFYHKDYQKLLELKPIPKICKLRLYSDLINELIGHPSLLRKRTNDKMIIELKKEPEKIHIPINKSNIVEIILSDTWNYLYSLKNSGISLSFSGDLELVMRKRVNYDDLYDYIREIMIYLQLFRPNKLMIDKMEVCIDDQYFGFSIPVDPVDYNDRDVTTSVSDSINTFLFNCYNSIPYRDSKSEIKNITHIVFGGARNIEDSFLMFYRFIECYYKKQKIKGITGNFISYSIINNYRDVSNPLLENIDNLTQEIICLRNQYVHSGYYLKNNCLRIKFKKIGRKSNPNNYTVNNVDVKWIYERTKILYDIVIDIIFKNMLGYAEYEYKKKF